MKADLTFNVYKNLGYNIDSFMPKDINKHLKAVIVSFPRRDVIVFNDNFGTRRKYPDFTEGKKAAGLHPLQIVFTACHGKYINENDDVCYW